MTPVQRVLEKLKGVRQSKCGWSARCPAHEDRKPSLSVAEGEDGRALVKCHTGCTSEAVCAALGLSLRDLMPERNDPTVTFGEKHRNGSTKQRGKSYPTANAAVQALEERHGPRSGLWTYTGAAGEPVGVAIRWDRERGKDFRPVSRHADGWRVAAMPEPRPLYRLPDLAGAGRVVVVEGEKCAEVARSLGFTATTSVGGSQAAGKTDWSPLAGKEVWILPDNDDAGRKYASDVADGLAALAPSAAVKLIEPRVAFGRGELPDGYDIADALADCAGEAERLALLARIELAASASAGRPQRPGNAPRCVPDLVCLADVTPTEVPWLWRGRIPLGRITLVVGRPGEGKSFFTCDAAARVGTGRVWPDGGAVPLGDVLLICAEDDPADTIAPRLVGADADRRRVHLLRAARVFRPDGTEASVAFDLANVDLIRDALNRLPECRLVVIDPVGSYLGGGVDAHRDNEERSVLAPLAMLAAERGVAVVLVAHARKAAADFADDTVLGSRAFTGLARSVLHVTSDPDDRARKLLLPGKINLSVAAPGLAYRITGEPPRLEWEPDPLDMHADDLMPKSGRNSGRGPEPAQREAAAEWLVELLAGGAVRVNDIREQADDAGLSWTTIRRAQRALNIKPRKETFSGGWVWELPGQGGQVPDNGRRRPNEEEPEHLRESRGETCEEHTANLEGAQVAPDLGIFATDSDSDPDEPDGKLFSNPTTNLPD